MITQTIQYRNAPVGLDDTGWLRGTLTVNDDGSAFIINTAGNVLSIQPDGSYQDRPKVSGPYEQLRLDANLNVMRVKPRFVAYAITVREA